MGYYLDSSQLLTLSKECGTLVSINILDSSLNPPQALASKNLQNDTDYYVIDSNESTAQIFSLIDDVHGQPSLILSTQLPRDAYQQGMSSLSTTFGFIVLIGLAMIVLCMILINNVVIARVSKLENDVKRIGKGDPNNDRLSPTGNDEIFSLSQEINGMIDNTEKRNQELRESEGRYKSIMEQSVCAIFIVNIEKDTILRTNQTFERIFGYSKEDIHQLKLSSLSSYPESRFEDFLKTISKDNPLVGKQIILKNKNGENLDVEISGSEIEYEGRRALSIIAWDVTEKHRLEREMARNQKLESLGVLAGGIAHDFNNMLTSIVSNIEIAKAQLPDNEMSKRRLEESVCSAMRAKHLTQQLLTFSKGGQPIKEILDLASIVRISTEFVLAGSKLVAEYDIEENLRKVFADPVQIDQVINNLIINAVQAMPRGGKLFIKVRNLVIEEGDYPLLESGHHIRIDIIDEGVGIPPNDLERIFDPFYTTKEKGSGLGLSTVRSIVSNHGGIVLVDSIVGKGTTFSVILPSIKTENLPAFYPSPEINNTTHHGRILVMDDEEPILDVLQTMLEDFGYQVACVRDGDEAISIYRTALSNGHPFQAVIMDLTIRGGMGGKEAVQGILALNPNARVIVSSGYSNDPIMANPQDYGFWDVLAKPFTMQDLSSKISSATANITNSLDLRETTKPIEDSGLE
jgi:PAS domain S-box-containing protein